MATVYISPTGNDDTGDGTQVNPYLTLSKANTESDVGDTILIMNGTYTVTSNNYNMTFNRQYVGESIGGAIFDGGGGVPTTAMGSESFEVVVRNITIQNFIKEDGVREVIRVNSNTEGVYLKCYNLIVRDCSLYSSSGANVNRGSLFGASNTTTPIYMQLIGCLFYNIDKSVGSSRAALFSIYEGSSCIFNECTFSFLETEKQNINEVLQLNETARIVNCIFSNEAETEIGLTELGIDLEEGSGYNCFYNMSNTGTANTGDITDDPKFIDAPNGNFRLQTISPCLGTGNPAV